MAPLFTLVRVQGGGNTGSSAVRVRYPDGSSWWWVHLYELWRGASRQPGLAAEAAERLAEYVRVLEPLRRE